ncbi:actin-like protein 8 [Tachyglossus aculeatus]|uniref:actin-like protein 8 n=1 Tax=Tachyglossus aculeatus TaxID=9261 RepID=UPI0018F60B4F|nr:actin-like protein 8 [Tachyglossus aculeatus]
MTTLVIDNGTGLCKAGFAGDNAPQLVVPTAVGIQISPNNLTASSLQNRNILTGRETFSRSLLEPGPSVALTFPVSRGVVTDWEEMERLWGYIFQKLRVRPMKHPVLLTEAPKNRAANRDKLLQIMFETFNVPSTFVGVQGLLALYACGLVTGVVLESGAGATHVVPVHQGFGIPHATLSQELGGHDLSHFLMKRLLGPMHSFCSLAQRQVVQDIKEDLCYVTRDYELALQNSARAPSIKTYPLPDGHVISVPEEERFSCPEALFQPFLLGQHSCGIHQSLFKAVDLCDAHLRDSLFSNLVVSGGNTCFCGFLERMKKEMTALAPPTARVQVVTAPGGCCSTWVGGSMLATLSTFQNMWVTREDYDEMGSLVIRKKSP